MTGGRHAGEWVGAGAACGVGLRVRSAWRPVRFGLGNLFAMPEVCGSAELRFAAGVSCRVRVRREGGSVGRAGQRRRRCVRLVCRRAWFAAGVSAVLRR